MRGSLEILIPCPTGSLLMKNAYYVVVTRGHLGDSACARAILKRPFAYFGMIGSRTKVRITREKLLKEGFTEEQLDQIHAPSDFPSEDRCRLRSREHHGRDRAGKRTGISAPTVMRRWRQQYAAGHRNHGHDHREEGLLTKRNREQDVRIPGRKHGRKHRRRKSGV